MLHQVGIVFFGSILKLQTKTPGTTNSYLAFGINLVLYSYSVGAVARVQVCVATQAGIVNPAGGVTPVGGVGRVVGIAGGVAGGVGNPAGGVGNAAGAAGTVAGGAGNVAGGANEPPTPKPLLGVAGADPPNPIA